LLVFAVSTPLMLVVVIGGMVGPPRAAAQRGAAFPQLGVFSDVVSLILGAYVEEVNIDRVMDGAMRGLADGLDASSAYLTPAEVKEMEAGTPMGPADVGVTVARQFYVRVVGVRDNSPAAHAALQTGDYIRAIDGKPTREMSALAGQRLLRGAAGTKVKLLVIRGNAADPHEVELTREVPSGESVTAKKMPGGQAYVRVASFRAGAAEAIKAGIATLGATATPGVVIDVRGTADGTPEEGIAAARLFVKSGTIATRAGRSATDKVVTTAAAGDGALTMPIVLLVSNGTGNAAEVFAAALAGTKRATLVGEPTAGLAGVQKLVKLPDGQGLWMTTQRYLLADGTPILEHGVRPEIIEQAPVVGFEEVPPTSDAMLNRATNQLMLLIKK